jgi:hypothetical protein
LSDDAQALFAHALMNVDSRSDLSGKQLADLTEMAQENLKRVGEQGFINPQAECANKIAAAAASPELDTVVREMVSTGLVAEFLVEMCKRRRIELKTS